MQGGIREAASVGKEDQKKRVRTFSHIEPGKGRVYARQSTREGSPPTSTLTHNRPFSCNSWHSMQCSVQGTASSRFFCTGCWHSTHRPKSPACSRRRAA